MAPQESVHVDNTTYVPCLAWQSMFHRSCSDKSMGWLPGLSQALRSHRQCQADHDKWSWSVAKGWWSESDVTRDVQLLLEDEMVLWRPLLCNFDRCELGWLDPGVLHQEHDCLKLVDGWCDRRRKRGWLRSYVCQWRYTMTANHWRSIKILWHDFWY